eukprot:5297226-Lingulodinium_polyedra.AAC.1
MLDGLGPTALKTEGALGLARAKVDDEAADPKAVLDRLGSELQLAHGVARGVRDANEEVVVD